MTEPMPIEAVLARAGIKRTALAVACGVDAATPYSWKAVPVAHVGAVARLTGIPAAELRPDLAAAFGAAA